MHKLEAELVASLAEIDAYDGRVAALHATRAWSAAGLYLWPIVCAVAGGATVKLGFLELLKAHAPVWGVLAAMPFFGFWLLGSWTQRSIRKATLRHEHLVAGKRGIIDRIKGELPMNEATTLLTRYSPGDVEVVTADFKSKLDGVIVERESLSHAADMLLVALAEALPGGWQDVHDRLEAAPALREALAKTRHMLPSTERLVELGGNLPGISKPESLDAKLVRMIAPTPAAAGRAAGAGAGVATGAKTGNGKAGVGGAGGGAEPKTGKKTVAGGDPTATPVPHAAANGGARGAATGAAAPGTAAVATAKKAQAAGTGKDAAATSPRTPTAALFQDGSGSGGAGGEDDDVDAPAAPAATTADD